jgi:hypothetical protein
MHFFLTFDNHVAVHALRCCNPLSFEWNPFLDPQHDLQQHKPWHHSIRIKNEPLDMTKKIAKTGEIGALQPAVSKEAPLKAKHSNRVSQPRRRGIALAKLQFNVPASVRKKLEAARERHDASLSELLAGAVQRCLRDDVWSPKARNAVARNRTIVPPPELVDMSNRLLELGMVLEQLMWPAADKTDLEVASRVYRDARVKLMEMLEFYSC